MEFGSLDEMITHIKKCQSKVMPDLANDIKDIMDKETRSQISGVTGQMFDSVVASSSDSTAEASFEDTGTWHSAITGEEVGNPIKFTESGSTWGRGASFIMDASEGEAEVEIPNKYVSRMRSKGIPIG